MNEVVRLPLDHIVEGDRVRRQMGDLRALADSLATIGLLNPITITPDMHLVAGQRRLAAARALGWSEIACRVVTNLDETAAALRAESDENTCREGFTPSEAAEMRRRIAEALAPIAQAREKAGRRVEPSPNLGEGRDRRTAKLAAAGTGFSGTSLDKVDKVVELTEHPDPIIARTAAEAIEQMDRTGRIDGAYRRVVETANERFVAPLDDGSIARARYLAAVAKQVARTHDLIAFSPERIAEVGDDELFESIERLRGCLANWFDDVIGRRPKALRRVK